MIDRGSGRLCVLIPATDRRARKPYIPVRMATSNRRVSALRVPLTALAIAVLGSATGGGRGGLGGRYAFG
jgi:hypothetical protein